MSKRVVSLLLTLLLALSVCIPVFATTVEPADQADVSESAETEETTPEAETDEETPIEEAPVEETPTEEEPSEEEPDEEAPTDQIETTETEEETETSSDTTPEEPATSEEEQEGSDEIATIAGNAKMITLKLIGAVDKLEIEDASGQKVMDDLQVPEGTILYVKSGLDTGYIVEENVEIDWSDEDAGGVSYKYTEDDGPTVETLAYYLRPLDKNNDGLVTVNIVKGVLVVLNDPYDGIYYSDSSLLNIVPSVLHAGDWFHFYVKPGFSVTVAGGEIDKTSDGFYQYDGTGQAIRRYYGVIAGAEGTLVINIEKTNDPIPPRPEPHPAPSQVPKVAIKYENESAFIGEHPDYFDPNGVDNGFTVYVGKDYFVKSNEAEVYFLNYYDDDGFRVDDFSLATEKMYKIYPNDVNIPELTVTAVKGRHDVKLVVNGEKTALISGSGLSVDGDILGEGNGKILLRNGYRCSSLGSTRKRYDVFGGEIFREYNISLPTDIDTLTIEVVKENPSKWVEISVDNPDGVTYSFGNYTYDYLLNEMGNYVFLYDDSKLAHVKLCEMNIKKGYWPTVVSGGTVSYERQSQNDKWMDVYSVTPDEKADKITIKLIEGANVSVKLPSNAVGEDELYDTVMHLLDMADTGDPELERLRDLIKNAVGKEVTAEVVMEEVPGPGGNFNVDDFNGEFYYVDIHIDIKIDGKVVGTIGTTDEALRFSQEYREELGRIVVLVREHNGECEYLPVEIDGDTLWFSSDMFSIFAIGYTNDINYAKVDYIPRQEYTGKPVEPEVVVTANGRTLTLGQDYTVTYENNIEEGAATAIITGINGLEGKREETFFIGNGWVPSTTPEPTPSTKPTPTPKPDYGIIPDVPWYQYQPEDEGEYVPGPDEVTYSGFPDVDPNAWYAGPVDWAAQSGVTVGYPDGNFHPDDTCTRAQIVTFLWKAAGTPMSVGTISFSDVEQESFYYDAAVWAANSGIIAGYPDGNFHPDDPCTRAQIVAMLYRYANSPAVTGESKFFDVDAGAYYYNAAIWAEQNGIVAGYPDGGFHPNDACTRAQIVTMLYNYIKG